MKIRRLQCRRKSFRSYLPIIFTIGGLFILGVNAYRKVVITGLQAEAHLMSSYIATLERAYYLEYGKFVEFEPYGAPDLGRPQCDQPLGARELGFKINWCRGISGSDPSRYFYTVKLTEDSENPFVISATSGSDGRGYSFVCFGKNEVDRWLLDSQSGRFHALSCIKPEQP